MTIADEFPDDIADIARKGPAALEALPDIGKSVAAAIIERVNTGRWTRLERLRGTALRYDDNIKQTDVSAMNGPNAKRGDHNNA